MTHRVYGVQPVLEALADPARVQAVLLSRERGGATQRIEQAAKAAGVRVKRVPKEALDRAAGPGARHQGAVVELESEGVRTLDLEALLDRVGGQRTPLLLLLDGIQDPGNLGAILRSAHALGAHGLVIPRDRAASLGPVAIKASAGAALHLPVAQVTNLKHALEPLAERGIWTAAAVMDGAPASEARLDGPLALVVGGEAKGVRPSLARRCDQRVRVPMRGDFDSLNASVAAGILLYEAVRQRNLGASSKRVDSAGEGA